MALFFSVGVSLSMPTTVFAEDQDLLLDLVGPTYTQSGANIEYELKVENTSSKTFTGLRFYNDLPQNVTYVSGGELIDDDPKYVSFTVPSLAPHTTIRVSWVAKVDGSLAEGAVITNTSFGFIQTPADATAGYNAGANTLVDIIGELESVYKDVNGVGFDVTLDSFGFQNFVHNSPAKVRNFKNDLLPEDLFKLFGPVVYQSGDTEKRVLTGPAQTWLTAQIADMNLGVCEGMAAVSLRLFNWDDFKGYSSPDSIQSGANTAVDLDFPGEVIENYVSYYYNTQYTDEVYESQISGSANETIATLKRGWAAESPIPYTLAIFIMNEKGEISGGHAITPYGIEKVSETKSRLLVYDNNYPKQRQYITVDTAANSWRYVTAATPGEGDSVYEGTGETNKLTLTPNRTRDNASGVYFKAPFGNVASTNARVAHSARGSVAAVDEGKLTLSYGGEGAYLVVNEAGQATGHRADTGDFVNEIPGAQVVHHRGGLGLNVPPRITIPLNGSDDSLYTVFVHAQTEGNVTNGNLHITGPGFSVGANGISLDPFDEFHFTFSTDGDHISFFASEDIEAPELVIAHNPIHPGDPSVIFDIDGVVLLEDEMVMIDLDPVLEQIHFNHTGPESEDFEIDMRHSWPDGDVVEYDQMVHLPAGSRSAFIDFGAWDGELEPPLFIEDVLQNPLVNHRLKQIATTGSYDPAPQANAPGGVYRLEATFKNVTEVSFSDVFFSIASLRAGDTLLNADVDSSGSFVSVPDELLGDDGILHMNESFTFTFEIGLATASFAGLTVDANGVPHDWVHPDPEPSYDANYSSFVLEGPVSLSEQMNLLKASLAKLRKDGDLSVREYKRLLRRLAWAERAYLKERSRLASVMIRLFVRDVERHRSLSEDSKRTLVNQVSFITSESV